MQKDIVQFAEKVKKLGYLIKIDTNGMHPEKLKELIDKKLVDYIAMDVKAPKNKYDNLTGVKTNIKKIEESIEIIKNSKIPYEFKTTFAPGLLGKKDIIEIAKWLKGSKKFYLQQFKSNAPLISSKFQDVEPYSEDELIETLNAIESYFENCEVRGI